MTRRLGDSGSCYSPLKCIGWFVSVTGIFIKLNLKLTYRLWQLRVSIRSLIPHINVFFSTVIKSLTKSGSGDILVHGLEERSVIHGSEAGTVGEGRAGAAQSVSRGE